MTEFTIGKRIALVCAVCLSLCLGAACAQNAPERTARGSLTVWVPYWDYGRAMDEARHISDFASAIVYFAVYFNESNALLIPKTLDAFAEETLQHAPEQPPTRYLSFVNDKVNDDGTALLKNSELLWALIGTPEDAREHIDDLLDLTLEYGFEGIEIDYEAIGSDQALWGRFASFLTVLVDQTQACGLQLRVLLEPSAPLATASFPEGPRYVMMCYNLYGTHGEPGPKADDAFLRGLVQGMQTLPGEKDFALATGGFRWIAEDMTISLTQAEAEALVLDYGKQPTRDADSGSLHFDFEDQQGRRNTVWYADGETLRHWRQVLADSGQSQVSLWRLGGNPDLEVLTGSDKPGERGLDQQ